MLTLNKTLKAGYGFNVGQDFSRLAQDTPARLTDEFALPGVTIAYIKAMPESKLGFMRKGDKNGEIRIHITRQAIID